MRRILIFVMAAAMATTACSGSATEEASSEEIDDSAPRSPSETTSPAGSDTGAATPATAVSLDCGGAEMTVLHSSSLAYKNLPFFVAQEAGFFEDVGLSVSSGQASSGAEGLAAVIAGDLDTAIGGIDLPTNAARQGAGVRAIGQLINGQSLAIVANSEVTEGLGTDATFSERIAQLEGLSIGVTSPGSSTDAFLRLLLEEGNIDATDDVSISSIGSSSAMVPALANGSVDAISIPLPAGYIAAEEAGGEVLVGAGADPSLLGHPTDVLFAGPSVMAERQEELTCLLSGFHRALQLIQNDPDRAWNLASPYFTEGEGAIDEELYRRTVSDFAPLFAETIVLDEQETATAIEIADRFALEEAPPIEASEVINTELAETAVNAVASNN